jgi:protein-tyrosine phosphatase
VKVLVICTANVCRSPIAETIFKARGLAATNVGSAGVTALVNAPTAPQAVGALRRHGYLVDEHKARQMTQSLGSAADLILVMEREHRAWVASHLPALLGRTYLIGQWSNEEIIDPIGMHDAYFDQTIDLLGSSISEWMSRF